MKFNKTKIFIGNEKFGDMRNHIFELLLILALSVVVICLAQPAEGKTIIVDQNGNGDYTSFQSGIENASAGDVIRLWKGDYTSNRISINKTVEIRGNGTSNTTINLTESAGLIILTDDIHMRNLSVIGGFVSISGNNIFVSSISLENVLFHNIGRNNTLSNITAIITELPSYSGFIIFQGNFVDNITLNGKKIYYIQDANYSGGNPFIIEDDASSVFIFNSSNIIVRNNSLINTCSVLCTGSTNITIQNNIISEGSLGIEVSYSDNNTIKENKISNIDLGISVSGNNNLILNNTITNVPTGISIDKYAGKNNIVESNKLLNSTFDVYLPYNIVRNNVIDNRTLYSLMNVHGTEEDPILIQGEISNLFLEHCSFITIDNATIDFSNIGIHILNSYNITITNCIIRNISQNYEQFSGIGIFLESCNKISLTENIISDNEKYGLYIQGGNNNVVLNNIFRNNGNEGIMLSTSSSAGNIIDGNIIQGSNRTLTVNTNSGSVIKNNVLSGNSIQIMKGNIVENNTYNGGVLYYFNDMGGDKNNVTIIEFDASVVFLYNCSNFQVRNNTIGNGINGIHMEDCSDISIFGNTISGNLEEGINIKDSSDVWIEDNHISNNIGNGIYLRYCEKVQISDNTISHNLNGIYLMNHEGSSREYVQNNVILGNSISNNVESGLYFGYLGDGNVIRGNMIYENNVGIHISSVMKYGKIVHNEILYNQIYNNSEAGLNYTGEEKYNDFDHNWWGDPTGPYHPQDNPDGQGNMVKGNIGFEPWLSSPDERISKESKPLWFLIFQILVVVLIFATLIFITVWLIYPFFVEPKKLQKKQPKSDNEKELKQPPHDH